MRVLLSWLRELVELPADAAEVARRLTDAGLEVEAIERLDKGLEKVVVGLVRERNPIPETKLSVCKVFDGAQEWQVVCGAQNYQAGDHVPMAQVGAVLPDGKAIGKARLRGHESFGMLCSSRELGFDDGVDGLHLLSRDVAPGTPIAQVLGRDDVAFEINVTPNRADALSHLGVARELSALFTTPIKLAAPKVTESAGPSAKVEIQAPELCPHYAARVVEGVQVEPSPAWLSRRLEALGQRSINNVVDATNLVMLERGQPLHAFDLETLQGAKIVVRRASEGETIRTLDGKDRTLTADDLVIADASKPVAIAGVMGGEHSEVKPHTQRLLLESAWFSASSVRRTARRQGLHSEASHRFERGIDPEGVRASLDRLAEVIVQVAGGRVVGDATDVEPGPFARARVALRRARMDELLGTPVPWSEALEVLTRLSLKVVEKTDERVLVEIPGARGDLTTEIDLIEEVVRVRGFHTVPAKVPPGSGTDAREDLRAVAESRLKEAMSAAGFDEAMNYAFVGADELAKVRTDVPAIALRNPIAADLAVMRTSLLAGLLKNLGHNLRRGVASVRLYETGRVYLPRAALEGAPGEARFTVAHEPRRFAFVAAGPRGKGWTGGKDAFDFYDLKGAIELVAEALGLAKVRFEHAATPGPIHPRSTTRMTVGGAEIGHFGELHPSLADAMDLPRTTVVGEFDLDALLDAAVLIPRYRGIARFPASLRDVAVVVDDRVTAAQVLGEIRKADPQGLVEEALLFDVYKGAPLREGRKNLAYSIRYRAQDRTLTDDEVNTLHGAIVARLAKAFGAELRA